MMIMVVSYAGVVLAGADFAGRHGKHWGYSGHQAPQFWGRSIQGYAFYKSEKKQSLIDITDMAEAEISPILE